MLVHLITTCDNTLLDLQILLLLLYANSYETSYSACITDLHANILKGYHGVEIVCFGRLIFSCVFSDSM